MTENDAADPVDRAYFAALTKLDAEEPGFLDELVASFHEAAGPRIAALEDALRTGNAEALEFLSHTLRGSCGTIGARRMAMLAAELENTPPRSEAAGLDLIRRLEAEYAAVRRVLAELLPGRGPF